MTNAILGGLLLLGIIITPSYPQAEKSMDKSDFIVFNQQSKIITEPDNFHALFFNGTVSAISYEYKESPKIEPKTIAVQKTVTPTITTKTPTIASSGVSGASVGGRITAGWASGQCTEYVAKRVPVYWRGNANQWITNARAVGIPTGIEPRVGSIVQTRESGWGHVAVVEKIEGNRMLISEQNYKGLYIVSQRWITIGDPIISGYIYSK